MVPTTDEWLGRRAAGAIAAGISFDDLLERSFIPRAAGSLTGISYVQNLLLTLNIVSLLDDETHGFGRARQPRGAATILLCCLADRSTLGGALDRVVRYLNASQSFLRAEVRTSRRWADLSLQATTRSEADGATVEEFWASFLFQGLCWFTGRPIPLSHLQVRSPNHPLTGQAHPSLGVPIVLGPTTALRIPAAALALQRRALPSDNPILEAMEAWMCEETEVAKPASRDARTARVVGRALVQLRNSDATLEEIAEVLGYSEARSLRRLITTKTGRSPQAWRALGPVDPGASASGPDVPVQARARALELLQQMGL